ncbi:MAG TPA: substrate-binding domain-containing protein [Candidatus Scybalocola faecigallinarum]|uniref:Substrate-binding domain-containing protein n=1 Tax=Candidatus Scybalocola faecigallinarum TaxID=2840941 RepID=A0A9D1JPW0_9FIRM|nr:substrate-binding domain-containing protein [Candidatus Scybalocola faecigallinarum]
MKKFMSLAMTGVLVLGMAACGGGNTETDAPAADSAAESTTEAASEASSEAASEASSEAGSEAADAGAAMEGFINVISREDGSGTRSAFVELMGIEQEDENGEKVDMTLPEAQISNSTSAVMTTVSGDVSAIGYISLGSLDDSVKAVSVNGVEPTADNVKSGDYVVSRPFNIITTAETSEVAQDFVNFIMSTEGQAVVAEEGYIPVDGVEAFSGTQPSGDVTVGGSSSVTPVMEKLVEAYAAVNPNANIEVQQSDSTTGVTSTSDGLYDIGMASRALTDDEIALGLTPTVIATDGIAVIVNNENPVSDLTSEQIQSIYTGAIEDWSELN